MCYMNKVKNKAEYHCTFRITKDLDIRITKASNLKYFNRSQFIKEILIKELEAMGI